MEANETPTAPTRLVALDAFRGLTIILMLIVNNLGLYDNESWRQLRHAEWNQGMNLADYIMPWFILCVGIAIPFSYRRVMEGAVSESAYLRRVGIRVLLLYGLGCLLQMSQWKQFTWGLDVLNLIALAYGAGAILYRYPPEVRWRWIVGLLVGYTALILFVSIPGVGRGFFLPDKNIIWYINKTFLQPYKLQGVLSVIPTTALVLIGTIVSEKLTDETRTTSDRLVEIATMGVVLTVLSIVLDFILPYNKPVWTPSYIIRGAGSGSLILFFFYYWMSGRHDFRHVEALMVFGRNAIFAYCVPYFVKFLVFPYIKIPAGGHPLPLHDAALYHFRNVLGPISGGIYYTIIYVGFWWLVCRELYRRQIFIKL